MVTESAETGQSPEVAGVDICGRIVIVGGDCIDTAVYENL